MTNLEKKEQLSVSQLSEDSKQNLYISSVFGACWFLALKFFLFIFTRYLIYHYKKFKGQDFFLNHWEVTAVICVYIFTQLLYGAIHNESNPETIAVMNVIAFLLEFLIIIDQDYSPVTTITMLSLGSFFLIQGLLTKIQQKYTIKGGFFLLFLHASACFVLFFMFALDYFHKSRLGYMQFNIFIGFYTYGVWTCLYFADIYNLKEISALRVSFAVGKDFYRIISSISLDLYQEFKFVDKSETAFNY